MSILRKAVEDEDGFTVIELIVTLGLLSLMTGLIAVGISLVQRGGSVLDRIEASDERRAVAQHLRRTIENIVPAHVAKPGGAAALLFEGTADRLRFVSRADPRLERGGLVLVELRADAGMDGTRFVTDRQVLSAATNTSESTSGDATNVHPLVEAIGSLRFRYYGRAGRAPQAAWATSWTGEAELPRLIEIDVAGAEGASDWPPIVVAIPAAAPTN